MTRMFRITNPRRRPSCLPGEMTRATTTVLIALALLLTACGRPFRPAELTPLIYSHARLPIDATVAICINPALRNRTWNVPDHHYRVGLGERAFVNFERLGKAAFQRTKTVFEEDCSLGQTLPWLSANIDSANRELDSEVYDDQITVVTMTLKLQKPTGEVIWQETSAGQVIADPGGFTDRHSAAARDLGNAIGKALTLGYNALMTSETVRASVERPAQDAKPEP